MKITVPFCGSCNESIHKKPFDFKNYFSELTDDLNCVAKCKDTDGHKAVIYLLMPKFQVLFDYGISSIFDQNKRAAVVNFNSALEEFYRFCIGVFLSKKNHLQETKFFDKIKLSERQFGAFMGLYFYFFKDKAISIYNKHEAIKNTRNDVVHNGKIPNTDKTNKYGNGVYEIIMDVLLDLKRQFPSELSSYHQEEMKARYENAKKKSKEEECCFESHSYQSLIGFTEILCGKPTQIKPNLIGTLLEKYTADHFFIGTPMNYKKEAQTVKV